MYAVRRLVRRRTARLWSGLDANLRARNRFAGDVTRSPTDPPWDGQVHPYRWSASVRLGRHPAESHSLTAFIAIGCDDLPLAIFAMSVPSHATGQPQGTRFTASEVATNSCWVDAKTGVRVPTGPGGWLAGGGSTPGRRFNNPDPNHVEDTQTGHTYVRVPCPPPKQTAARVIPHLPGQPSASGRATQVKAGPVTGQPNQPHYGAHCPDGSRQIVTAQGVTLPCLPTTR